MRTSGRDRSRGRAPAGDDFDEDFGPEGPRDSLTDVPGGVRLQKVMAAAGVARILVLKKAAPADAQNIGIRTAAFAQGTGQC